MAELFGIALPLLLFVVGVGLTIAEAFIPGAHFIVIGVALLVAGLVGLLIPGAGAPLVMALTTLVVGVGMLYLYRQLGIYGADGVATTTDSGSLKGMEGVVTERVTAREGEVKLDDGGFNPFYRARALRSTIEEGERVLVVDPGGGTVVKVQPVGAVGGDIDRELARERERNSEAEDA
jgi:membrane protein implicated in regulation of membrane protease activity